VGDRTRADEPEAVEEIDYQDLRQVLHILKAISARRDASEVLYAFTRRIADALDLDRCSVVRIRSNSSDAHVLASHEDPEVKDIRIDLAKYPEVVAALDRGTGIVINDVSDDPLVASCRSALVESGIAALVVLPLILFDSRLGSFLLRAARRTRGFTEREVHFCELVAESTSNALERAYLLEELRQANENLQHLARTDGLTGLYNQRYFRERFDEEVARALRYHTPLALMFLDVDDFKNINDTYGHMVGDEVLREIAARTLRSTRQVDLVARYGGEEIVVLLPQTDRAGAIRHGVRLLERIAQRPFEGLPEAVRITASIGLAVLDRGAHRNPDALLSEADSALYKAKRIGKNRLVAGEEEYANQP